MTTSIHSIKCTAFPILSHDEFLALVGRVEEGSAEALADLENIIERCPDYRVSLGNVARMLEDHLVGLAARTSRPLRRSIERFNRAFRTRLTRDLDDPMEAFLIHRVILTHLDVMIRHTDVAEAITVTERRRMQWTLDQAQRRQMVAVAAMCDYFRGQVS